MEWVEKIKLWVKGLIADFTSLTPTEQIAWALPILSIIGGALFFAYKKWRKQAPNLPALPVMDSPNVSSNSNHGKTTDIIKFRWIYQWEFSDSVLPKAVEPPLEIALAEDVARAALTDNSSYVLFVRGELGIGKSTLKTLLPGALNNQAKLHRNQYRVSNFIKTTSVIEAGDATTHDEFTRQVSALIDNGGAVIVLARHATIDAIERRLGKSPDKSVTMLPFAPEQPLFEECLNLIAKKYNLTSEESMAKLRDFASRFDTILRTPFYFEQAAQLIAIEGPYTVESNLTPLEVFQQAIDKRASKAGVEFDKLLSAALNLTEQPNRTVLTGILTEKGFVHDGYRNVILAAGIVSNKIDFSDVVQTENAIPAIQILVSHIRASWKHRQKQKPKYVNDVRQFAIEQNQLDQMYYPLVVKGLIASMFQAVGDEVPANAVRRLCLKYIKNRPKQPSLKASQTSNDPSIWWDISAALSCIGDPRLIKSAKQDYSFDSGYFTAIGKMNIEIGSDHTPKRTDLAKPVLSYNRQTVEVGPLWVGNFLITNELFAQFWDDPKRDTYFVGTGRQWIENTPALMERVEDEFNLSAMRCFWKELSERESVAIPSSSSPSLTPLELARRRALRDHLNTYVPLWDSIKSDPRFSASGQPVVGVNWWEAMAFCNWWEKTKLIKAGFPKKSRVSLLTDWEWEAIRRKYYNEAINPDGIEYPPDRYNAHTRVELDDLKTGRPGNVIKALHVGLAPTPSNKGPNDMVGNVWEWTRSRIFGKIEMCEAEDGVFGKTKWNDVDRAAERMAIHPKRDVVDDKLDLSYRTTRGGSFFSRDSQGAWHPAYRLCDPPFSSYIDLGFRIAVYPDTLKNI